MKLDVRSASTCDLDLASQADDPRCCRASSIIRVSAKWSSRRGPQEFEPFGHDAASRVVPDVRLPDCRSPLAARGETEFQRADLDEASRAIERRSRIDKSV